MSVFKPEIPKLLKTEDGTHTLHLAGIDETYHSHAGALTESIHVYIHHGYHVLSELNSLKILEIGFGTGMNAMLTLQEMQKHPKQITYHSLEPYPIPLELLQELDMGEITKNPSSKKIWLAMHQETDNTELEIVAEFYFTRFRKTLHEYTAVDGFYDLIYYDAFAPRKQPEMWTYEILSKTVSMLKTGGIFITYCANGQFKRDLKQLGLTLQNPPGIGGRKEITQGRK